VPLIVLKETSDESVTLPSTVEAERKLLLEATIVRVMKTRKTLNHNQLVEEITRQVSNRFTPTQQAIKSRIEALIEREYLVRDEKDMRIYIYQA
jgi:cullin 3